MGDLEGHYPLDAPAARIRVVEHLDGEEERLLPRVRHEERRKLPERL
jgi:hypothetical protein